MRAAMLAAVLLLAACTGASPDPSGDPVRILSTDLSLFEEPFKVALIDNLTEYESAWGPTSHEAPPPEIDFQKDVAIYLGMAGSSSCPATFQHLVVDEDAAHVYAEWNDPNTNMPCTADLAPQGVLLAVSRGALPAGEFRLTLRQELLCFDCPDNPDQEVVTVR
jgi:hypothetical protein